MLINSLFNVYLYVYIYCLTQFCQRRLVKNQTPVQRYKIIINLEDSLKDSTGILRCLTIL